MTTTFTAPPSRRRLCLQLACAGLLAGCATRQTPPRRLYGLTGTPPLPADARPGQDGRAWVLSPQIALPELLDRDEILVADGNAGLGVWPEARWAEPLRDALPRVLAEDLWRLRQPYPVMLGSPPENGLESLRLVVQVDEWLARPEATGLRLKLRALALGATACTGPHRPARHRRRRAGGGLRPPGRRVGRCAPAQRRAAGGAHRRGVLRGGAHCAVSFAAKALCTASSALARPVCTWISASCAAMRSCSALSSV